MKTPYIIGNVIEVNGTKVRILMNDRSDLEQYIMMEPTMPVFQMGHI